jgi:hypothetical protein
VPGFIFGGFGVIQAVSEAHGTSPWLWAFLASVSISVVFVKIAYSALAERDKALTALKDEDSREAALRRLARYKRLAEFQSERVTGPAGVPGEWRHDLDHLNGQVKVELQLHAPELLGYWEQAPKAGDSPKDWTAYMVEQIDHVIREMERG